MPDSGTPIAPVGDGNGDLKGNVYGGRQPIEGAAVYLYGAPSTGYATSSTTPISLLGNKVSPLSPSGCNASVVFPLRFDGTNCYYYTGDGVFNTVDPLGGFNLSGLYYCDVTSTTATPGSALGQQVWIYSIGGSPSSGYPANPQASLTAGLGTCNVGTGYNFSADSYIFVNEVSTVAFEYAVAGFALTSSNVATSSTNLKGLTNAFNNAAQLYDIFGVEPGDQSARHTTKFGTGSDPYYLINTLADVIATCINSNNPIYYFSTSCKDLFNDTYGSGYASGFPTDTASAVLYLAQHPYTNNTDLILGISAAGAPWSPNYSTGGAPATPVDLTAAISYSGSNITTPAWITTDGSGNAYVTMVNALTSGFVTEVTPVGVETAKSTSVPGQSEPTSITIDSFGDLYTLGAGNGELYMLANSGGSPNVSGIQTPFLSGDFTTGSLPPAALTHITADKNGYVYVANNGNNRIYQVVDNSSTFKFLRAGTGSASTGVYTGTPCPTGVSDIAVDSAGYLWTINSTGAVCKFDVTPGGFGTSKFSPIASATTMYDIAIDSSNDAWISFNGSFGLTGVVKINSTGTTETAYATGGLANPSLIAIDGANNVWAVNQAGYDANGINCATGGSSTDIPSLSEINSSGAGLSPPAGATGAPAGFTGGYQNGNLSCPAGLAIDISGDVWVSNNSGTYANTLTEVIGAAFPTKNPMSLDLPGTPEFRIDSDVQ